MPIKALRTCFPLLTAIALLVACTKSTSLARLEAVEAVIDSTPEEAYYMLDSIDPTTLHGEALALYALLCTQADYQCYVPLTSDSLIRLATDYYDNSSPHHRAALAHYYLGCTYTELGDDAEALRAYMQALTLFPDTTVRHYALCYQNMARHYRNRNMLPESLAAFTAFRNIMQQRGSATDVFNAVLSVDTFRANIASVHDVRRLGPDYSVKGDIYAALGHADSARHYYHLALLPRRDVYADCNTYYKLIEIALAEGCTDSISSYIEHHTTLLDSIACMQSRAEVDRVHADHDMLMYDRTMRERHIRFVLLGIAIVAALALALLALFVILDNRRKSTYIRLQKQLAQNRAEMLTLTATSDDSDTSSTTPDSERLYALRCQRIEYCRQLFAHTEWQTRISQIEHRPEALLALTLSERNALQQVLVDTFADAMIDFKNECPSLTSSDLQLLIFTLLGCSIRTISICTAISENALRSRKTRMKAKMSEQMYLFVFG